MEATIGLYRRINRDYAEVMEKKMKLLRMVHGLAIWPKRKANMNWTLG